MANLLIFSDVRSIILLALAGCLLVWVNIRSASYRCFWSSTSFQIPGRRPEFECCFWAVKPVELSLTDIAVENMVALFDSIDVEPRFYGDSGSLPALTRPLVHKRLKLNDGVVMPAQVEDLNLFLWGGSPKPYMDVRNKLVTVIVGFDPSWSYTPAQITRRGDVKTLPFMTSCVYETEVLCRN